MINMRNEFLRDLLLKAGVFEKNFIVSDNVEKYPEDKIIKEGIYNYLVNDFNMTDEDIKIALLAKQTLYQKTIKNIVVFNFALSIIAAILFVIVLFAQ